MKRLLIGALALFATAGIAKSEVIGVSISSFDDPFLTIIRNSLSEHVKTMDGVSLVFEDAANDVTRQQNQLSNFLASGVDAIITIAVDTDSAVSLSKIAEDGGVPMVYVNRMPINVEKLPENQAFVGSDERESGTLETQEVCRLLNGKGKAVVIMGDLSNDAARVRTKDIHDVLATEECKNITIVEQQTANWRRLEGMNLMANWLSAGVEFDAVISNDDETALGAIQAMKAVNFDRSKIVVAGINASEDALFAMKNGDLQVSVFQDGVGQATKALDTALDIIRKNKYQQINFIPYELVTPKNVDQYINKK